MESNSKSLALFVALAGWVTAHGQAPANEASAPTPKPSAAARRPVPDEVTYDFFIRTMYIGHNYVQKEIQEAKEGSPPIVEGKNYADAMGISMEEYQLILDTVLTTHSRLVQNEHQQREAFLRARDGGHAWSDPEVKRLAGEHDRIIQGMLVNLRQGLGDDHFGKFDKWVKQTWGVGIGVAMPMKKKPAVVQP